MTGRERTRNAARRAAIIRDAQEITGKGSQDMPLPRGLGAAERSADVRDAMRGRLVIVLKGERQPLS